MREIKFRGLSLLTGDWVHGGIITNESKVAITNYDSDWLSWRYNEVDSETVGQYTGLKDKNGKEIYEGDVLQWTSPDSDGKMLSSKDFVVFGKGQYWVENTETKYLTETLIEYLDFDPSYENVELIGNIHENPELLGEF